MRDPLGILRTGKGATSARGGSFMAKRANDLLDVFRLGSGESDAPRPKARGKKGATRRGRGRAAEGVFLAPRQVTLLASTAVLLVVLAFAAGLGYGRRGATPGLQRTSEAPAWWVRGRLPARDPLTGKALPVEAVVRELQTGLHLADGNVHIVPEDDERLAVFLGPFGTKATAQTYYEKKRLDVLRLRNWGSPFYRSLYEQRTRPPGR